MAILGIFFVNFLSVAYAAPHQWEYINTTTSYNPYFNRVSKMDYDLDVNTGNINMTEETIDFSTRVEITNMTTGLHDGYAISQVQATINDDYQVFYRIKRTITYFYPSNQKAAEFSSTQWAEAKYPSIMHECLFRIWDLVYNK